LELVCEVHMEFKIDKGVPIPSKQRTEYPWGRMEVGDSFFVEKDEQGRRLATAVKAVNRRVKNKKFIVRKVLGGYRCWRIE
jgi:hypothetical protein